MQGSDDLAFNNFGPDGKAAMKYYGTAALLTSLTDYIACLLYTSNGMRQSKSEAGDANRSTLEELLRGNVAGLPEIVEPAQLSLIHI